jgi:hypothetical protein
MDMGEALKARLRGFLVVCHNNFDRLDNQLTVTPSRNELVRRVEHQQQFNKHRYTSAYSTQAGGLRLPNNENFMPRDRDASL